MSTAYPWGPTLEQVAAYIPARTMEAGVGVDQYVGTFTAFTTPTREQAESIADDACSWVSSYIGVPQELTTKQAASVAAIRAAGMIELTMPVGAGDVNTAQVLLDQASALMGSLVEANTDAGGTDPNDVGLPVWYFPVPDPVRELFYNGRSIP